MTNPAKVVFTGENIACQRGGRMLFQNLSFSVSAGEILCVTGPNGSGKTSFLRILSGALDLSSGKINWNGKNFTEDSETHLAQLAFLPPDDRCLKPLETVFENLMFWAGVWNMPQPAAAIASALERMGIAGVRDRAVRYLSAGQKRRVSLARLLLREVPLWLIDEPLNGLDAGARDLFAKALQAHAACGGISIVASHDALPSFLAGVSYLHIDGGAA